MKRITSHNLQAVSVIISAVLLFHIPVAVHSADWNYNDTSPEGPSNWMKHYPTCGETYQSPINLITTSIVSQTSLTTLAYTNYDQAPVNFVMVNNGHSVQITIPVGQNSTVAGGGLGDKYILEQFHFHWGADDSQGSEHLVDGKQHPLEIHLVHYNSKYTSVSAAANDSANPVGVGVIAVFVDVGSSTSKMSSELGKLTENFPKVPYEGNQTQVTGFAVSSLIPPSSPYYRYNGSLTTPGCAQVVVWTVYRDPIYITATQMAAFRQFHTDGDEILLHNFRPTQSLSTRAVYSSVSAPSSNKSEHVIYGTVTSTLALLLVVSNYW